MNDLRPSLVLLAVAHLTSGAVTGQCRLFDNGDTDGSNGYSNRTIELFGDRRALLDDFVVTEQGGWELTGIEWTHLWNVEAPGNGIGMELGIREDAGGAPGDFIAIANIVSFVEIATGNVFFGHAEALSRATFDAIVLGPGVYWFEAVTLGADLDTSYWLVRASVNHTECWVNYDEAGGLQPGSYIFGVPADLNFKLLGSFTGAIGTNYCDALPNSSGQIGRIVALGSAEVGDNDLTLIACQLPVNETGYVLNSMHQGHVPIGDGVLCLGPEMGRHVAQVSSSGDAGQIVTPLDLYDLPRPKGGPAEVQPGDSWYFTLWHRDGNSSNFTDGVCIVFE